MANGSGRGKERRSNKTWTLPDWRVAGRWLLGLVLFGSMGGAAVWGFVRLQDPAVMPLTVVRIDGEFRHLDRRDLEQAVGGAIQGNFFTVDVAQVRKAAHALPWVDEVSVRRVWPGTLKMHVTEQVPLARWGAQALVTGRGVVFQPPASELPEGLPELSGPDGSGMEVVAEYLKLRAELSVLGLQVAQLSADARGGWRLRDQGGMEVHFGTRDQAQRLARFIRVYPRLLDESPRPLVSVDLRYTNGIAVVRGELPPAEDADVVEPSAQNGSTRGESNVGRRV